MTKKFLLVLSTFYFLLNLANSCSGQNINLGIKAGAGLSELYQSKGWNVSSMADNRLLINFSGGILINFQLNEKWSLHSEILYEDKGQKSVSLSDSEWVKGTYRRNVQDINITHNYYLDFPQTIRYDFPLKTSNSRLYIEAGIYFAYYITSKIIQKTKYDGIELKNTEYENSTEIGSNVLGWNRYDWGLKVGMGFLLNLKRGTIDFNIADEQTLKSFIDDIGYPKTYVNIISLTVGYSLPVKTRKDYK